MSMISSPLYRGGLCPSAGEQSSPLQTIIDIIDARKPRAIAIDGGAACGKSTLAGLLAARYDCNVIHMDDFFLPPERKTPERLAEPGGNVDYERFRREVTERILSGERYMYHRYDCKTGTLLPVMALPKNFTVVEGVYSLHPLLRDVFDLKIFLKAPPEEQRRRILERSGAAMLERFVNEWIPLEDMYFEKLGIEKICDMVFD